MNGHLRIIFIYCIIWKNLTAQVSCQLCEPTKADSECIKIETWHDFKKEIYKSKPSTPLTFCPFYIEKKDSASFVISNEVEATCQEEGQCVINASPSGGATIIKIRGSSAKVKINGFVFENSGSLLSAVHVTFATSLNQLFCRCTFRR